MLLRKLWLAKEKKIHRLLQEKIGIFIESIRKRSTLEDEVIDKLILEGKNSIDETTVLEPKEVEQGVTLDQKKKTVVTEEIVTVQGDGNRYFRCISHILYGTQKRHIEVRSAVVREMELNKAKYE